MKSEQDWLNCLSSFDTEITAELLLTEQKLDAFLNAEFDEDRFREIAVLICDQLEQQSARANTVFTAYNQAFPDFASRSRHNQQLLETRRVYREVRHRIALKVHSLAVSVSDRAFANAETKKIMSRLCQTRSRLQMTNIIGIFERSLTLEYREKYIAVRGAAEYEKRIREMEEWLGIRKPKS